MVGLLTLHIYVIRLTTGQKFKTKNRPNLKAQTGKIFTQGAEKAREFASGQILPQRIGEKFDAQSFFSYQNRI